MNLYTAAKLVEEDCTAGMDMELITESTALLRLGGKGSAVHQMRNRLMEHMLSKS